MPFFYWYPLSWYPSRYPLKATQNRTAHQTAQRTQAFFSTQANGTQGSTQRKQVFVRKEQVRNDVRTEMAFFSRKTISRTTSRSKSPFLVSRKTISRRTSRSKSLYFLANRASANSKIVVTSLLVTSEMILSKLQLSSELSTEKAG